MDGDHHEPVDMADVNADPADLKMKFAFDFAALKPNGRKSTIEYQFEEIRAAQHRMVREVHKELYETYISELLELIKE